MTRHLTTRSRILGGVLAAIGLAAACTPAAQESAGQAGDAGLRIVTLSAAQPYLVSGGDVLVRVEADDTVRLTDVVVLLDDEDVTRRFRPDPGRHALLGLVTGLTDGDHTLALPAPLRSEVRQELTSYPIVRPDDLRSARAAVPLPDRGVRAGHRRVARRPARRDTARSRRESTMSIARPMVSTGRCRTVRGRPTSPRPRRPMGARCRSSCAWRPGR